MMDVNEYIMSNEVTIRLSFFLGVFAVMAMWEFIAPRRALTVSKVQPDTQALYISEMLPSYPSDEVSEVASRPGMRSK